MSIDKAIELGEKTAKDLEAKKEADRLAAMTPEQKQAEEAKAKAEAKAAEEQRILEAKDEELDESGKAQKAALLEKQAKEQAAEEERILKAKEEELSEEERETRELLLAEKLEAEKEARREAKTNARIDEIMGELKAERNARIKDQEAIKALESELKKLRDPGSSEAIDQKEAERQARYLKEDAKLPRDKRREMPDAELEEWLLEDIVAAQRWLAKQELRRDKERTADLESLKTKDDGKAKAEEVMRRQAESKERVARRHPELDVTKRMAELKGQGKTDEQIQETIFRENPKARIVAEILRDNPDRFLLAENGPELLADEMERRLSKSAKKTLTQEELDAQIEERVQAELRRRESLPDNMRSNRTAGPEKKLGDLQKAQWETYQKMFPEKSFADFEEMLRRREKLVA